MRETWACLWAVQKEPVDKQELKTRERGNGCVHKLLMDVGEGAQAEGLAWARSPMSFLDTVSV